MEHKEVRLVECPRDAMQGWKTWIPTDTKIRYINALIDAGFDTIDFGSFVSPKAIPQMADTKEVLAGLHLNGHTKLLAIVANERGATEAVTYDAIRYLGYPFSVSETFQLRNTNHSITESFQLLQTLQQLGVQNGKELVVYISMGFGNPYGDPYSESVVQRWIEKIAGLGIRIISLADTVGVATPAAVHKITAFLVKEFPEVETGVHLHASRFAWKEKVLAAVGAGCRRFDGALKGVGGCPMANDELVGNLDTELLIPFLQEHGLTVPVDKPKLAEAAALASEIFQMNMPLP